VEGVSGAGFAAVWPLGLPWS